MRGSNWDGEEENREQVIKNDWKKEEIQEEKKNGGLEKAEWERVRKKGNTGGRQKQRKRLASWESEWREERMTWRKKLVLGMNERQNCWRSRFFIIIVIPRQQSTVPIFMSEQVCTARRCFMDFFFLFFTLWGCDDCGSRNGGGIWHWRGPSCCGG